MPGTGITNLDLILSQMSRMRNQISSGIIQPPIGAEPSDRWLKRLPLDISDPDMPGSKRPKVGDSPPLRQRDRSFDIALPCNRTDTGAIDRVKEDKSLDEGKKLQEKQERTPILEKSVNSWTGRWCQGGTLFTMKTQAREGKQQSLAGYPKNVKVSSQALQRWR